MLKPLPQQPVPQNEAKQENPRAWLGHLRLQFGHQRQRTALLENSHVGPLSVQRPFYPEADNGNCCHIYLLHPPGGLVAGDSIGVDLQLHPRSHALLTTPSAGKIYRTDAASHLQQQNLHADIAGKACLEWLPQESIVFAGANARIHNRFQLHDDAKLIAWDIVCLGRRAGDEPFNRGCCEQLIEVEHNGQLLLRERNIWPGDSKLMHAPWGMAGFTVAGTLFANLRVSRADLDAWREQLVQASLPGEWGLTQKQDLFIARFLGQSAQDCRRGFELLWHQLRPLMLNLNSCRPRIWNT